MNLNDRRRQLKEIKSLLKKEKVFNRDGQFTLVMTEMAILKKINNNKSKGVA